MAWNRFASAEEDCPVLRIPNWMLLQHFWFGLRKNDAMRLNALSEGSFVHLDAVKGREILDYLRYFSSPCIPINEAPTREIVEPPRSIVSRVRDFISTLSELWLKMSFLNSRSLRERFHGTRSTLGFPSRASS